MRRNRPIIIPITRRENAKGQDTPTKAGGKSGSQNADIEAVLRGQGTKSQAIKNYHLIPRQMDECDLERMERKVKSPPNEAQNESTMTRGTG